MESKPHTLVILSPGFAKDETDTTCLPSKQALVRQLVRQYPQLEVIVLAFQYPYQKARYTWHGANVRAFGGSNKGRLRRVYNWIQIWAELRRIKKSRNIIGLLSFWMGECALVGGWFARRNKLKHFCWICGQDARPGNRYFKRVKPAGASLITLSDFLARSVYKNYGIMPSHVIPGGVMPELFGCTSQEKDIDVMACGSLIQLKQFNLFIETISRLRKTFPGIKAVLCGDGPEKDRLLQIIRKLDLQNNIRLTGALPHGDVLKLMQQAKVFLHTSGYEGQGMVMAEALFARARVISFVKPFDCDIENWQTACNTMEMATMAAKILADSKMIYRSVAPFLMQDTANSILALYDNEAATSAKRLAIAEKESVEW